MVIQKNKTQLAVLGAGPGGYHSAFRAADAGFEVTLIDTNRALGGACLHVGCIPSKTLLHLSELLDEKNYLTECGIDLGEPKINLSRLREYKNKVISQLSKGLSQLASKRKVRFYSGRGSFLDAHTLRLNDENGGEEHLSFDYAVVATGSRPFIPEAWHFESPFLMNSSRALDLEDVPQKFLVIGGGYIGLEIGSVYAALGSQVTLVEQLPTLLSQTDPDLVAPLRKKMEKKFSALYLSSRILSLNEIEGEIKVKIETLQGLKEEIFNKVLIAVGRIPNSSGLNLSATQVKLDKQGFIVVDPHQKTEEPHIFAIGDICPGPMLAHKASYEARIVVDNLKGNPARFDAKAIPCVVYTNPQIAWCGLTENEAKKLGQEVRVLTFPWIALGAAVSRGKTNGLTKIIVDPKNGQVKGAGITGHGAGDLIAEMVLAIEMGATATDLAMAIHPHPSLSESIMEASELYEGGSVHLFKQR
ncbi:MAG: dihydrolipoyl dehydrogenase [Deltaproteobacteria bacterium RIFCSPLOWO2_12_FULL_40_28]|nr:MAG: dihydrolipoyl dehydrogenase [Deltaproteobacteria bacterium RIFCSPHIGHO2_02_FULL_40_28]OGQ19720.1 MAG: dihydrolipoyl dehydrogenase [Deltaproteobacteria bacterium RIFCSPHIGHO2_12_FULL_40_32]OGQ40997.1 MAG: dihydrolipoyl dehydrogenase [Deltaproteobacteria bacterium RIFCSPLOWO2_02_FULL_40_36]OGQ54113.1 MAG: dihydrolipoyl dehydrogenase [Deltaproteobacteria bacterium RIFCSPLOWO2_12_FULL_40_28]